MDDCQMLLSGFDTPHDASGPGADGERLRVALSNYVDPPKLRSIMGPHGTHTSRPLARTSLQGARRSIMPFIDDCGWPGAGRPTTKRAMPESVDPRKPAPHACSANTHPTMSRSDFGSSGEWMQACSCRRVAAVGRCCRWLLVLCNANPFTALPSTALPAQRFSAAQLTHRAACPPRPPL